MSGYNRFEVLILVYTSLTVRWKYLLYQLIVSFVWMEWQSELTGKGGHSDTLQECGGTSSQSIIDTGHNGLTQNRFVSGISSAHCSPTWLYSSHMPRPCRPTPSFLAFIPSLYPLTCLTGSLDSELTSTKTSPRNYSSNPHSPSQ
jgi:hypothetical protein